MFCSNNFNLNNKKKLNELFLTLATMVKNESQIDKATAVSGSGPGYIFTLIHAFEKAAEKIGFSKINPGTYCFNDVRFNHLMQETKKT